MFPNRGRLAGDYRELVVKFSNAGYIVRYSVEPAAVSVIGVRSQREDDYPAPHP